MTQITHGYNHITLIKKIDSEKGNVSITEYPHPAMHFYISMTKSRQNPRRNNIRNDKSLAMEKYPKSTTKKDSSDTKMTTPITTNTTVDMFSLNDFICLLKYLEKSPESAPIYQNTLITDLATT